MEHSDRISISSIPSIISHYLVAVILLMRMIWKTQYIDTLNYSSGKLQSSIKCISLDGATSLPRGRLCCVLIAFLWWRPIRSDGGASGYHTCFSQSTATVAQSNTRGGLSSWQLLLIIFLRRMRWIKLPGQLKKSPATLDQIVIVALQASNNDDGRWHICPTGERNFKLGCELFSVQTVVSADIKLKTSPVPQAMPAWGLFST